MKKKSKTLGRFLTKKYITTSFLLIFLLTLTTGFFQSFFIGVNENVKNLCANTLVRPDYKKIDIAALKAAGGWVEILDENNRVIYTKGDVKEKRTHYTQKQLLNLDGLQALIEQKIYQIGPISFKSNTAKERYIATFSSFVGNDGRDYLCIAKLPKNSITGTFVLVFSSFKSSASLLAARSIIVLLFLMLLIFIFCLWRYSKSVKEHIVAPNEVLMDGLRAINHGDYEKKIHLNAEHEYVEIEDSFNRMADQLKTAEQQRAAYEKERQLLFANMAHDLRTPITTIKGSAKAVADGLVRDGKLDQTMQTILSKADHMSELVNRLLIFSKLESPDYQLHPQTLDLSELIREVSLEHLEIAEKRGIELIFDLPETPLEILGDGVELRRVFDNLISNSIQHNPAGSRVHIRLYAADKRLIFEVRDNGGSIPKELQDQLFVPFVSGDDARSTNSGSGLGLAISKKIIEKHGGKILFVELNEREKMFQVCLYPNL